MANVAALTMQLEDLKDKKAKAEKVLADSKRSRTVGLAGVLIGIFLIPAYGLGILLIIAGLMAAVTQNGKHTNAKQELDALDKEISEVRQQIAAAAE
jgi:hypothetical protein